MLRDLAAVAIIASPPRCSIATSRVGQLLSLSLASWLAACAPGEAVDGLGPEEPSPITQLTVSPNPASVATGGTQVFSAIATRQDGSTLAPSVTWTATGGTITAGGGYTAGAAAGSYAVTASLVGGSLSTSVPVTVSAVISPIVSIAVSPPAAVINAGATQAFIASATRQDGSTLVPSVTWSATGGAINLSGVYTAGSIGGNYRVIAVLQGGTLADTSAITIPAPVLQAVILTPASVSLNTGATQQFSVSGQWSNGATTAPPVTYSATGGTITAGGLYAAGGTAGAFRVIAVQQGGSLADTSTITLSAGGGGTTLFSEEFEDGNLGSRGWFGATSVATFADARPGSSGNRSLEWHWAAGQTSPHTAARIDFTPSNSVYLSYWVKQSSNWIGSGAAYHPHMFQILTTADDHWIGPSRTHLTLLHELLYISGQGGSRLNLALQDPLMIDTNNLMVDLTNVSEQRAIAGYNGHPEPGLIWDEYGSGGEYYNGKMARSSALLMTDATKNSWHHVESYWRLNTISGGKGQPDGVVQAWFDGVLVVDRADIYFRTNANSTMQFRTFLLGPYIGNGSPRDQFMWVDDLVIATAKP